MFDTHVKIRNFASAIYIRDIVLQQQAQNCVPRSYSPPI